MPRSRLPVAVVVALVACAACDSGSSRRDRLLAQAVVGPDGGDVAIDGGAQDGWRLAVPAGALAAPTVLRVFAADLPAIVGAAAETSTSPIPAPAVRIEPVGLQLLERATLHAPYRPQALTNTAPGNVRLREVRNGNVIDTLPTAIDVAAGCIEAPIRFLGSYQVVVGPRAGSITDYWQPIGAAVALAGGRTFAVEPSEPGSPFAATCDRRWRYEGPHGVDLLHFAGDALLGREATDEDWRETWTVPYGVWQFVGGSPPPQATTIVTQVQAPTSSLPLGGQITVQAQWSWDGPQAVGDELVTDIVRLWITLTWNRADLGVGTRDYRFWFAPGLGLVALAEDGVVHRRTAP